MSKQLDAAAARIAELEKQLSELRIELITSYGESEELSGEVVAVKKQRDTLLAAAQQAANEIRKCDYTPARSTLLTAIASVKGGAA